MKQAMRLKGASAWSVAPVYVLCVAAVLFGGVLPAAAQQKDKKNKTPASDTASVIPRSDEQQVDLLISTMLGAWQIADIDKLHECYADDVTIIAGTWIPPIIGWNNYLPLYQQQRARMKQVRMDRSNTLVKVDGTYSWATYQWDFSGVVDGQASISQGHTTLVMEKRNGKWVIVLNHTSVAEAAPKTTGATQQH